MDTPHLDVLLASLPTRGILPGGAYKISHNGETRTGCAGTCDMDAPSRPFTTSTITRIASMTKVRIQKRAASSNPISYHGRLWWQPA